MIVLSILLNASREVYKLDNKECKPHKWEYRSDGKMQCSICKVFPGTIKTSGGNYD